MELRELTIWGGDTRATQFSNLIDIWPKVIKNYVNLNTTIFCQNVE
jgi:hypothetical protein